MIALVKYQNNEIIQLKESFNRVPIDCYTVDIGDFNETKEIEIFYEAHETDENGNLLWINDENNTTIVPRLIKKVTKKKVEFLTNPSFWSINDINKEVKKEIKKEIINDVNTNIDEIKEVKKRGRRKKIVVN